MERVSENVKERDQEMVEKERRRYGGKEIIGRGIMERRRMANARKYGDDGEEGLVEEER